MTDREHIEALAAQLGAHLIYDVLPGAGGGEGSRANQITRVVHLVPWGVEVSRDQYWTALHEFGHLAQQPLTRERYLDEGPTAITSREADAWSWAIRQSHRPLDEASRANLAWSMASYIYSYGAPTLDPTFDEVIREAGPSPAFEKYVDEYSAPYLSTALANWPLAYQRATAFNSPYAT